MSKIQSVPLSACKLALENARHTATGDVGALAISIAAEGLLDPLQAYRDGEWLMVWDGGRRLRALQSLAKAKRLPKSLVAGVPIRISEREAARRRSLVTFVREGLHPVQEFQAYKALADDGQDPNAIAAAMGVDARRVAQLLKLGQLAPEILVAFEAGEFGLDTAQAFTLTDDLDRQREVLEACSGWINAGRVRQLLRTGMISSRERLARFVGRDAYIAAGGEILTDLFAEEGDAETWTDSGLVERLAAERTQGIVDDLKVEGWAWVTVLDPHDYAWGQGYDRLQAEPVPLSEAEQAEYDQAVATRDDEAADDEALDDATDRVARLEAKVAGGAFAPDQVARSGVFVQIDGGGQVVIRRGYVATERATANTSKEAVAADPSIYGWGHTGHWHLTHIATAATRHALLAAPLKAYDVLVANLAWRIARGDRHSNSALKLEPRGIAPAAIPTDARLVGETDWGDQLQAWRERLPADDFAACFNTVIALDAAEKAEILALGVGLSLDAVEARNDQHSHEAWDQLQLIGRYASVDINEAWTPNPAFLAKGSKAALLAALGETGGAEPFAKAKKGEMVATLARRAEALNWTPKLLRGLAVGAASPSQSLTGGLGDNGGSRP